MKATGDAAMGIAPAPARAGSAGATDRVVEALREAIVSLEIRPGAMLDKAELTRRFGVSRFPVSEALQRLKAEGLVDIRPQSGSMVSRIRLADARENMFLRRALEAEAVAHHAVCQDGRVLAELKRSMRYQRAALDAGDRPGFHRLDLEFHDIIVSGVGYPRVRGIVEGARLALDRARRLLITPRRHVLSFSEHAAILTAVERGDAAVARGALCAHVDSVMAELEAFSRAHPAVFADGDSGSEAAVGLRTG
jgi:DNA-binding GntR family transcriptional regulator